MRSIGEQKTSNFKMIEVSGDGRPTVIVDYGRQIDGLAAFLEGVKGPVRADILARFSQLPTGTNDV